LQDDGGSMIKIRLTGDTEAEVTAAIQLCERLLPNTVIAPPRQGSNPKYAGDQKWLAYGEMQRAQPRQRRKATPKATAAPRRTKPTTNEPDMKPSNPTN
jgi:hypothetical protein